VVLLQARECKELLLSFGGIFFNNNGVLKDGSNIFFSNTS
jgi:hypothetical protein